MCRNLLATAGLASGLAIASPWASAAAGGEPIEEIVVTAQRRTESLQEVAASITAVDERTIEESRIESPLDLQRISPSVVVSTSFGATQLNIRGLGYEASNASSEASVLAFVDGVYMARPTSLDAIFGDLERIEVLRGPQGTLYGRNATGGVISFITRQPGEDFDANFSATYGEYDRVKLDAGIEGAISDATAARLYVFHDEHDGDQEEIGTGKELRDLEMDGARLTVVTDWTENFSTTVRGDYVDTSTNGPTYDHIEGSAGPGANPVGSTVEDPDGITDAFPEILPALPNPNDGEHVRMNVIPSLDRENWGISLTAEWGVNESIVVKSITAYREADFERNTQDYDGTTAPLIQENYGIENSEAWTQEVTVSGETDGGTNWVVGAYYFREDLLLEYDYDILLGALFGLSDRYFTTYDSRTESFSVFGQATMPLTNRLNVTAGVRQNYDDKEQVATFTVFGNTICQDFKAGDDWSDFTWKVGADYSLTDQNMIYATVAKGFKAGGLNVAACDLPYDPEEVISYEVGTKNTLAGGRLLLNGSVFYYDYTDLQVNVFTATTANTENAATAEIYGAELEAVVVPMEHLEVSARYSWNHSEYEEYFSSNPLTVGVGAPQEDLSGRRLPHTPETTFSATAAYSVPLGQANLDLRYDFYYNSGWWGDSFHNSGTRQNSYNVQDARIALSFDRWELGAFVENLADETYAENRFTFGTSANVVASWAMPRTWGVFLNYGFDS